MNKALFIVASVATAIAIFSSVMLHQSRENIRRLEQNQVALLGDVVLYKTRFEHSAASAAILELRVDELRRLRDDDARKIRSLRVRLNRAESYAKSVTHMRTETAVALRDTVIVCDTVRLFDAELGHTTLSGRVASDSLYVDVEHRDTIYQVVHRVPRKFLFFRFGTKAIRQDVWSSNPATQVVYTEYIDIAKPKRVSKRRRR